jgi:hypothetical protein
VEPGFDMDQFGGVDLQMLDDFYDYLNDPNLTLDLATLLSKSRSWRTTVTPL